MEQTVKMESSTNLEGDQNGERSFTIVQYDLTSSEDERDDDKSYIYCSAKLSPPRPESTSEDELKTCADQDMTSSSQDSESSEDEGPQSKRPRIIDLSSNAPSGLSEPENVENQSTPSSETTTPITTTSVITIASSSEDEAQHNSQQQEGDEPLAASPPPRKPYALRMEDLPNGLKQFLNEARSFFTRPHSLGRHGQHVAISTYSKAEERVLCFLGHVRRIRPKEGLSPAVFNSQKLIEAYLDFLKEDRRLTCATISNHASSLLYPLKYFHRFDAPRFDNAPIISQLRKMATVLQKQGDVDRSSTREDFIARNKWLDWDEVLEARLMQLHRFEMARSRRERAREACDLLLLSLYCHIPPGRGLEVRTLEIVYEAQLQEPFLADRYRNRNIAVMQKDGGLTIHLQRYKTCHSAGKDTIAVQADSELFKVFKQFVSGFRAELHPEQDNDYLFVNANGQPYSSGSFTKRLQRLFQRLTGRQVSINVLRSSFITWAYSQSDCDDALKDSLAAALRHSKEQAQSTYDRRTANERKAAALELARRKAEQDDSTAAPSAPESRQSEITVGQFVGLVAEDSTLQKPSVFLGRVQAFLPGDQVCLLWYKNVGGGVYSLQVDGSQWVESKDSLVPVEVGVAKGRPHSYRLRTSLRTIHKAVLDGGRHD